ncbi:hypothetical protein [Streptomyces sp. V2I9]|uniref:hypothetical protein n=1 Tax=Streptomyces sp. V2I9 TaxID=3042304 RepID=UPI002783D9E9|nr:hypothetical protein [Streptomyces sp. V2I9]MDQ0984325.1 hypothetical protein [Streptomyces sp. V2I9]
MNQCTAVASLPPPKYAVALADPGQSPETGHVLCELGEGHEEAHAAMLWDKGGRPGSAVWARWGAGPARLTPLPWCAVLDPRDADAACGLFAGHPAPHDWEIADPTDEAITRELARQHPHLFR